MTVKVEAQLIGTNETTFKDGRLGRSIDVRLASGDSVTFWATNEAQDSVKALDKAPMGTTVSLDVEIGSRDGKPQVRLIGVAASSRAA